MQQRKVNERSGASGSPVALSTVYTGHAGLKKKKSTDPRHIRAGKDLMRHWIFKSGISKTHMALCTSPKVFTISFAFFIRVMFRWPCYVLRSNL